MLTHDAPIGVLPPLPPPPSWWDMAPARAHQQHLAAIVDEMRPSWLTHGHYHLAHEQTVQREYGPLHVTGLDMDGALFGNYRVLNVTTMEWETR